MTSMELMQCIGLVKGEFVLEAQEPIHAKHIVSLRSIKRAWLIAAIVSLLLLLAGCAIVCATLLYGSPAEMIAGLYGEQNRYQSASPVQGTAPDWPGASWTIPGYDKQPIEAAVAQELEKWVSPVGQRISSNGYRLTVDAFIFDSVTQTGLMTMLLEHDNPLTDEEIGLSYDGRICNLHGNYLNFNQYGWPYLIPEKTTDAQLAFTFYFYAHRFYGDDLDISFPDFDENQRMADLQELREQQIKIIRQRLKEELTVEQAAQRCQEIYGFSGYTGEYDDYYFLAANEFDTAHAEEYQTHSNKVPKQISVALPEKMALPNRSFGNGNILVNSICARINNSKFAEPGDSPDIIILHMKNSSDFIIRDQQTDNSLFCVTTEDGNVLYMLNSAVNIDNIQSVEIVGDLSSADMSADIA